MSFELIQLRPEGGDCTAPYDVRLNGRYTVRDFINEVLTKHPRDWGFINIVKVETSYSCDIQYKDNIIGSEDFPMCIPASIMDLEVISATASGGWSRMDYHLRVKEKEEKWTTDDVFNELRKVLCKKMIVDAHEFTYIIMGRPGPTGKTSLTNHLKRWGYNAIEISESIYDLVQYIDSYSCPHNIYRVDEEKKVVTIVLNKPLVL